MASTIINIPFQFRKKQGIYRAIFSRRDVRSHFSCTADIVDDILVKILNAAHHAPSVGFSRPWNFILIKDKAKRQKLKESFENEFQKSMLLLKDDKSRQKKICFP